MKRISLLVAVLAFFAGVIGGAYAADQQVSDELMNYQASHGQSVPTTDYPNETSGRY